MRNGPEPMSQSRARRWRISGASLSLELGGARLPSLKNVQLEAGPNLGKSSCFRSNPAQPDSKLFSTLRSGENINTGHSAARLFFPPLLITIHPSIQSIHSPSSSTHPIPSLPVQSLISKIKIFDLFYTSNMATLWLNLKSQLKASKSFPAHHVLKTSDELQLVLRSRDRFQDRIFRSTVSALQGYCSVKFRRHGLQIQSTLTYSNRGTHLPMTSLALA